MSEPARAGRLRHDLPFRRIAVVLPGGGALASYEVGVLKVLEQVGLEPAIVAGVSAGAVNALLWLAHGRRTAGLEQAWRRLRPPDIGVQWSSLVLRLLGTLAVFAASLEILLALLGTRELSGAYWLWKRQSSGMDIASTQLDIVSWILLLVVGAALAYFARPLARRLSRAPSPPDPERARRRLGQATLVAALLHVVVWVMGWPWPHRFSATMVLLMAIVWAVSGGDRASRMMHKAAFGFMPETGGRGLWSGSPRRRVLERLLEGADRDRLTGPGTGLVVSALAVDSGRVCHFTSWPDPDPEFVARVERELGEVVPVRDADEMMDAVIASSAIPGLFEPQRIGGRDFVDAGGFANQPIHVVLASVADAALVVLMSPSASPTPAQPLGDVVALGNRLLEIATWRDLQAELRQLPPGWGRDGDPARVCVVEPGEPLPSSLLMFDGEKSSTLVDLGVQDTWAALDRAGWLERSERDSASTR